MSDTLTITEAIKTKVVMRAKTLGCDLVSFWRAPGVPMTLGNSETMFRTPSYITHFDDHDWLKVTDLKVGDKVLLT